MTVLSDFDDDERAQIMDAPGAVMEGAIFADGSRNAIGFLKEVTAGAKVFKQAQRHENGFVKSVAIAIRERGKDETGEHRLPDPNEAVARALGRAERAVALIGARATRADRDAYCAWLLRIATEVAAASPSKKGGFFSRRVAVSEAEQSFIDDLEQVIAA